jgi:hypothetical protein
MVYVSGNLLLFYERGNKRRHVSPDVFVVKGVAKHTRPNYLLWQEGRGPDVVIELTSSSTRSEDTKKTFALYRDVLRVPEYFLFDPLGDYLKPPLQGYRLRAGQYRPLTSVRGRLRSKVLGLDLEQDGKDLSLVDPVTNTRLPTVREGRAQAEAATLQSEAARQQEALARQQAEVARQQEARARQAAEAEIERLRRQMRELRRRSGDAEGAEPE